MKVQINKKPTRNYRAKMIKRMKKKGVNKESRAEYLLAIDSLINGNYEQMVLEKTGTLRNDEELADLDTYTDSMWSLIYNGLLKPMLDEEKNEVYLEPVDVFGMTAH